MMSIVFLTNEAFQTDLVLKIRDQFIKNAKATNLIFNNVISGTVSNYQEGKEAINKIISEGNPCIIVFCSWVDEGMASHIIQGISSYPLILVGFDGPSELISISGLIAVFSNISRQKKSIPYVIGNMEENSFWVEMKAAIKAAEAVTKIRNARIALIGHACPGMQGTMCSEVELQSIGPEIIPISISKIMHLAEDILKKYDIEKEIEREFHGIYIDKTASSSLPLAVSIYFATKKLIDEFKIDAVAFKCWPEMREIFHTSPCYAISKLEDDGIAASCEADLLSATTQLILKNISTSATFTGDIAGYDTKRNVLHLWHTGSAARTILGTEVYLKKLSTSDCGVSIEANLKHGNLTLAKLSRPLDGVFQMFAAKGESIKGDKGRPGNNVYIRTYSHIDRFIRTLLDNKIEHHIVLSYGFSDISLRFLSKMLNISFISPDF